MTQGYSRKSTFDSPGQSRGWLTKTNSALALFVKVEGSFTPGNEDVEVTLEGSPKGDHWSPLGPNGNDPYKLTDADLYEQSTSPTILTAHVSDHHIPIEVVRVNVSTLSGSNDISLEATIFFNQGGQRGVQYDRDISLDPS